MERRTFDKYEILIGDSRETLSELDSKSVQCVVTSPPYFGLRNYGNDKQIGLEETVEDYVSSLVEVFSEIWRVLRDDGIVWLNLGDSYAGGGGANGIPADWESISTTNLDKYPKHNDPKKDYKKLGFKKKDLIGVPWRVAFALQDWGWYLRQDIIWHKPNPMPESVTDRCTKSHEYLFLLSKSPRYFYDAEAVRENKGAPPDVRKRSSTFAKQGNVGDHHKGAEELSIIGRNRRSVWTIATQPYSGAHFATFPPKLIEPCILAGTSEKGQCPHCGSPWRRNVDRRQSFESGSGKSGNPISGKNGDKLQGGGNTGDIRKGPISITTTTGWEPTCNCPEHDPVPQTVLDPFGGSGTTAGVSIKHGRKSILCELNSDYVNMIRDRINHITNNELDRDDFIDKLFVKE